MYCQIFQQNPNATNQVLPCPHSVAEAENISFKEITLVSKSGDGEPLADDEASLLPSIPDLTSPPPEPLTGEDILNDWSGFQQLNVDSFFMFCSCFQ